MGDLFSGGHIILIMLVVLLLFGGKKIPELMRGLGRGIREFKDAKDNVKKEFEDTMHHDQNSIVSKPVNTITSSATPVTKENTPFS